MYWVGKAICQRLDELDTELGNSVDAIRTMVSGIRNDLRNIDLPEE
jgi:hypothetical protein